MRVEQVGSGSITYVPADLRPGSASWGSIERAFAHENVLMAFGFPPCTDLASSGALHWRRKGKLNPAFQQEAVALATVTAAVANKYGWPYVIENPKGALARLWGRKRDLVFNPYQYGGYLPEDDVHPTWPKYIAPRDAYTKETNLWVGNGFTMPAPIPVVPEIIVRRTRSGRVLRGSRQFMFLGGSSLKTQNIRNATPRGFAQAVKIANYKYQSDALA